VNTSYNGWPASPDPAAIGIDPHFTVGGVAFPGGVKSGDVSVVLRHVLEQFNQHVETLIPGYCWGYEFRNATHSPEALSCHASGTAVDVNAPLHGDGASGTFTPAQVDWIEQILRSVGGVVVWGAAWNDEMHLEIKGTAAEVAAVAAQLGAAQPPKPLAPLTNSREPDDTVTDEELDKIAQRVWSYIVGGGGAGATLEEIRVGTRDANAKLSKLCDPRNGNVDGTG
jgi:hypothetical protein